MLLRCLQPNVGNRFYKGNFCTMIALAKKLDAAKVDFTKKKVRLKQVFRLFFFFF